MRRSCCRECRDKGMFRSSSRCMCRLAGGTRSPTITWAKRDFYPGKTDALFEIGTLVLQVLLIGSSFHLFLNILNALQRVVFLVAYEISLKAWMAAAMKAMAVEAGNITCRRRRQTCRGALLSCQWRTLQMLLRSMIKWRPTYVIIMDAQSYITFFIFAYLTFYTFLFIFWFSSSDGTDEVENENTASGPPGIKDMSSSSWIKDISEA